MAITGNQNIVSVNLGELSSAISEIQRRGVDGTTVPLFVDTVNQRVIIGGTEVSANPAKVEINGGDLKIIDAGSGVIIPSRDGLNYYRLIMENDGAIAADLVI